MGEKFSAKTKYKSEKNAISTTLGVEREDLKLKLTLTDQTVVQGKFRDVRGVEVGVEKHGHFILAHELQEKVTRFQFHGHAKVLGRHLKMTFIHHHGRPTTTLETSIALDHSDKIIVKNNFFKKLPVVKYEHTHKRTTIEPSFDFSANTWAISAKQKVNRGHIKVSYDNGPQRGELEWHHHFNRGGPLKVVASTLFDGGKRPTLTIEKEWELSNY